MEEGMRGPAQETKARPIGCPWQLLNYAVQLVECRLAVSQRLQDARCQPNCDVYTHLTALNEKIKTLQEELHDATCEKRAEETTCG